MTALRQHYGGTAAITSATNASSNGATTTATKDTAENGAVATARGVATATNNIATALTTNSKWRSCC